MPGGRVICHNPFQFAAHKTHNLSMGVIFASRNNCQTNRRALGASYQGYGVGQFPTLNLNSRLFVLRNGHNPVPGVDASLSRRGRARKYFFNNDVVVFHHQDGPDADNVAARRFGGAGRQR